MFFNWSNLSLAHSHTHTPLQRNCDFFQPKHTQSSKKLQFFQTYMHTHNVLFQWFLGSLSLTVCFETCNLSLSHTHTHTCTHTIFKEIVVLSTPWKSFNPHLHIQIYHQGVKHNILTHTNMTHSETAYNKLSSIKSRVTLPHTHSSSPPFHPSQFKLQSTNGTCSQYTCTLTLVPAVHLYRHPPGRSFINCPCHALNDFLRGAWYGHREGWNSV